MHIRDTITILISREGIVDGKYIVRYAAVWDQLGRMLASKESAWKTLEINHQTTLRGDTRALDTRNMETG